jgi:uncharacterized coiled-coil protein SlyX
MVNPAVGYQPRTTPAERRADLAAQRRTATAIEAIYTDPDTFTGPITVDRDATDPNLISNKSGATNVDGVVHVSICSNGTEIGRITRATSTTAGFLTSSDEQLKQNLRPIDDEITLLWMRSTEPLFFEYKDRPDVRHVGYSAQQIAELWPNAVTNGIVTPGHGNIEDRTFDEDGNETTPYGVWQAWMMDHAKLTPVLHAGLRTLDRLIDANTDRITELEDTVAYQAAQINVLQVAVADQTADIAALATALADLREAVYYTRQSEAFWQYSNTVTPPPGAGQMRTDVPITTMWIHRNDTDGYDRRHKFDFIIDRTAVNPQGIRFRVRGATGAVYELRTNGQAVNNGTYYTIPVTALAGTASDKGFRVELTALSEIWAEDPPT